MSPDDQITLPAPAKLNLFLHIIGRRADGYHNLQTVFQYLDFADTIHFTSRHDARIELSRPIDGVPVDADLCWRAATLLQTHTGIRLGVDIDVTKVLPMGGGLGGGSSNAATTLVGLNKLWNLELPVSQLKQLALKLGADVPVFVHGHACWAEGVGDRLTDLELDERWYIVLHPSVNVSTAQLFAAPELTRNCSPITIRDFLAGSGQNVFENVFEPVVKKHYPQVAEALEWLATRAEFQTNSRPAMTGTGSCVFLPCQSEKEALNLLAEKPLSVDGFVAKGANVSVLHRTLASIAGSL